MKYKTLTAFLLKGDHMQIAINIIFGLSIFLLTASLAFAQPIPLIVPGIAIPLTPPKGLPMQGLPAQVSKVDIFGDKPKNPSFNLVNIPISQLLTLFFSEINTTSFVLAPEISKDERNISFRYDNKKDGSLKVFTENLLDSLGYQIKIVQGTYFVGKKDEKLILQDELFEIYRPKFRDSRYLINLLRPIFSDNFSAVSKVQTPSNNDLSNAAPGTPNSLLDTNTDTLIFHAKTKEQIKSIYSMLEKIDIEENNLLLKAYIYEVNYSNTDASALGLVLNLASKKLNINLGSQSALENSLKFTTSAISLIFSNINTDSRFKLLSNPYVRIKNGKTQKLIVGASVPYAGEVSYVGNGGTPVQSTKQVDTGFVLSITPTIKQNVIDIDLDQQISEAQISDKNTPTITKRQLITSFTTKKNEIVMLAGLSHNKDSKSIDKPFMLPWLNNNSVKNENTEIIIFVEVVPVEPVNDLVLTQSTVSESSLFNPEKAKPSQIQ